MASEKESMCMHAPAVFVFFSFFSESLLVTLRFSRLRTARVLTEGEQSYFWKALSLSLSLDDNIPIFPKTTLLGVVGILQPS